MRKYYDDSKHNAAFDRFVDVMAKMMLIYGTDLLQKGSNCSIPESKKHESDKSIIGNKEGTETEYSATA